MANWHLKGKKALITGGTKGIGKATATEFLQLGAEVLIIARNGEEIKACLQEWQTMGFTAQGIAADVCSAYDQENYIFPILKEWKSLDILVNNVGTNIRKEFIEYEAEEIRQIFETNIFSAISMTKLCFEFLEKSTEASVINVSSVAALVDVASGTPYGMTKAAELQFTRNLAVEWAKYNIRVNAVSPWYTRTPLTETVLNQPARLQKIIDKTPLNRVAEPEEMATAITFLALKASSYITGHNLVVDGGMTIKTL
ncbi:SDR family oxidoreductase [Flectobacillus major]|jgi:NAD(P)-dependent dehydrogenase (short-subunit alcohol dehydrogenase family)|uniref:SDR family oxidoreductase n=1 Tax=Flectobacillus major TaxID=103 RepID=UPI000405CB59|nr:SDR family oxidoreductase [Flectobacillus major]